jgi:CRP/FNR family transcriptional regulator
MKSGGSGCAHDGGNAICRACNVRSISICAALSDEELHALSGLSRDVRFAPGDEIAAQGDRADSLWNVSEGVVRLVRILPDGRRQIVGFLYPGDFLGLALAAEYPNAAEAVTSVRACRFERRQFEALLSVHPKLLERLHRSTANELSAAQDRVVALGRQTAEERVAGFVVSLQQRRARAGGAREFVELPMTRQDIADYLGLTIETVSRTLSRLASSGTIEVTRNGVAVRAPAKLEALAAA